MKSLPAIVAALPLTVGAANAGEIVIKRAKAACGLEHSAGTGQCAAQLQRLRHSCEFSAGDICWNFFNATNGARTFCRTKVSRASTAQPASARTGLPSIFKAEIVAMKLAAFASRSWQAIR
jgi:hypothetical protein